MGTVLLVTAYTGRYGLAGAVAAAGAAGYAVASPLVSRMADRHGQGKVLRPAIAVFAAATTALIVGVVTSAPAWVSLSASGLAGAATPQIGSMVRARWSALLGGSQLLHTAFSLESVADEVIYVVGPVLVTVLATQVSPPAGLAAAGATCLAGTLALAAQRRSEPPPQRSDRVRSAPRTRGRLVPGEALVTLLPVFAAFGAMLAAIDLATVAFASDHGHEAAAGLLLGGYALGSAAGGLWYGAREWRSSSRRRLSVAVLGAALGTATFCAMPGLLALGSAMLVSGLVLSPMLITGFSIIEQQAPSGRLTEAMAWLTSAISVGTAIGAAAAGQVIATGGPRWGYVLAALCGAAGVIACALGFHRLEPASAACSGWG